MNATHSAAIARGVPNDLPDGWELVGVETLARAEARVARERDRAIRCGDVRREMFHVVTKPIYRWREPKCSTAI